MVELSAQFPDLKIKEWRIDYCMVSDNMKPKVKAAYILNDAVHSDHCPAVLEIE